MESRESTLKKSSQQMEHDTDNRVPRSYSIGQTIDLLERRQEAAVLRHLRRLSDTDPLWAENLESANTERRPSRNMDPYSQNGFHNLSKAQIAEVMAGEQKLLESRIQRSASRRQSVLLDGT